LSFTPADSPSTVLGRCSDGYNAANIVLSKVGELKDEHTTHGASNYCSDLLDTQIVQDKLEDVDIVPDGGQRELRAVVLVL